MALFNRETRYYFLSFLGYDLKASITVFFVALPLCLGIALASNAPIYSGLLAGIIGGLIIPIISKSPLSVSGPAAGLTSICAAAIFDLGGIEIFFISVAIAGILQVLLGILRLGGFTHFIPSAVIKGMLVAIGILLISKQIPLLIGYDKPDFWTNELFNILTFDHGFEHIENLYRQTSAGAVIIAITSFLVIFLWNKFFSKKIPFLPSSFICVLFAVIFAILLNEFIPALALKPSQFVSVPQDILSNVRLPDFSPLLHNREIWKYSVLICFVATLETLLSIEAIDKLDPYNRITPQNRELVAQGTGNVLSGLFGGLPITAVIVRSSANAEAGARTKLSAIAHGLWLVLTILVGLSIVNRMPYSVLAVLLIRTGYNLAKPKMIRGIYKQGREQFLPFIITVLSILFTDLLIGVSIGIIYAIYFLIKHTYRAGFIVKERMEKNIRHITIELALNVSFLNKKRMMEMLDRLPGNSIVEINGADSVYIDRDILEVIQDFKSKARQKKIDLKLISIPEVETIELH